MPFKPNYRQQRNERSRAKDAKKQEKLQRKEEEVARRKAARDDEPQSPDDAAGDSDVNAATIDDPVPPAEPR